MNPQVAATLRKRILMLYFAGGANIVMALLVLAAGGGTTGIVAMLVFFAFAVLQFYMARNMQKRWDAMRQQQQPQAAKE
ncbi:MAG TPA: hypothetical protein VM164_06955 [Burkholderiales bacterium]|nr:hypothetical protein [Burkholderiales bacterium]